MGLCRLSFKARRPRLCRLRARAEVESPSYHIIFPRQWKVIQTVREMFSCRSCETIAQPPAPFHVTPRCFAGPSLLAMRRVYDRTAGVSSVMPRARHIK